MARAAVPDALDFSKDGERNLPWLATTRVQSDWGPHPRERLWTCPSATQVLQDDLCLAPRTDHADVGGWRAQGLAQGPPRR